MEKKRKINPDSVEHNRPSLPLLISVFVGMLKCKTVLRNTTFKNIQVIWRHYLTANFILIFKDNYSSLNHKISHSVLK